MYFSLYLKDLKYVCMYVYVHCYETKRFIIIIIILIKPRDEKLLDRKSSLYRQHEPNEALEMCRSIY